MLGSSALGKTSLAGSGYKPDPSELSVSFSVDELVFSASFTPVLPQPEVSISFAESEITLSTSLNVTLPQPSFSVLFAVSEPSFTVNLSQSEPVLIERVDGKYIELQAKSRSVTLRYPAEKQTAVYLRHTTNNKNTVYL